MDIYGLRYEEHRPANARLPFIISPSIHITDTRYSHEANWHENLELQYCLGGCGQLTLDTETMKFSADDVVVVNTNVIHHITSDSRDGVFYACLIIDRNFCEEADICTTALKFESKFSSPVMSKLFRELLQTYSDTENPCRVAKLRCAVLRILIELRESHLLSDFASDSVGDASFERVKNAIKYIRSNFEKKLTLDVISKEVMVNKYLLSREFKKVTGQTIIEYANAYRCKIARDKIISGETVADAAIQCGFENLSFFTRTFKRYMGKLPSKFKSNNI